MPGIAGLFSILAVRRFFGVGTTARDSMYSIGARATQRSVRPIAMRTLRIASPMPHHHQWIAGENDELVTDALMADLVRVRSVLEKFART